MKKKIEKISVFHMDGYYNVTKDEIIKWLKSQMRSYYKGEKFPYEIPEHWKISKSPGRIKLKLHPGHWLFEDAETELTDLVMENVLQKCSKKII